MQNPVSWRTLAAAVILATSAHSQQLHTLWATDILPSTEWVREPEATGDPGTIVCEGQPRAWAANNTLNPAQLHVFLFDPFTPPFGHQVTGLWVNVLARYGDNMNGGIRVMVKTDSGQQLGGEIRSCFSSGSQGNCRWRLDTPNSPNGADIFPFYQGLGISQTDIHILDVFINRVTNQAQCPANGTNLKVKAIKVIVETSPCPVQVFCGAANNSTGQPTRLVPSGVPSQSASTLTLRVQSAPTNAFGLLWWGTPTASPAPSGNGVLCLSSPHRIPPIVLTNGQGQVVLPVNLSLPAFGAAMVGDTLGFQFVHRDVGGSQFNWSSGVRATVCL